jgi:hypothetical protein
VEHRHPRLRVRRRADPAPGPVQGRPGPHRIPAHPRPGPRPGHRADVRLADGGQARLPGHCRPAQRAAQLAAQLPATDADAAAARNAEAARLQARIRARFADLHHEREQIETQLANLARTTPVATDPALLDELPLLGDILPDLPPALKARLLATFGIEILWNKPGQQVTVFAEITDSTLQAIPGITDPGQDGYNDTSTSTEDTDPGQPAPMWDLTNTHRSGRDSHLSTWVKGSP